MKQLSIFFSILFVLVSCKPNKKEEFEILITHATIVDVKTGKLMPEQIIGINNDTIRLIIATDEGGKFYGKTNIDAKGKYIIPGLWDNHVHFRGGDSLIQENKDMLPLFLKYGITTVRDGGGDITPSVLEWKKAIQKGGLMGPTIFTPGPKLDGENPAWAGSIKVTDKKDIENALDSLESLGADYVKMYDGSLTKESFYNIIQEAEKRGLKTTGHMPLTADFMKAVELGMDGSEHLYYVLKACSPKADSLTELNIGYSMMSEILKTYDPELAEEIFAKLAKEEVFITPTLYIGKTLAGILEEDHSQDSLKRYIGAGIQKTWQGRIESAKSAKDSGSTMRQDMENRSREVIKPMFEAGVPLLAGSDCGPFNSYVYPGQSLHGELRSLVSAGLTPQQALQTSFQNGPAFFDLEKYYGSVETGKVADILILDINPLENIEFSDEISVMIHQNKVYDKRMLEALPNVYN